MSEFDPYLDAPILAGDVPECILMQFTGLHDKNGKEIYEGDVVEIRYNDGTPAVLGTVRWSKWGCNFAIRSGERSFAINFGGSIVVGTFLIGNIYENPELLP